MTERENTAFEPVKQSPSRGNGALSAVQSWKESHADVTGGSATGAEVICNSAAPEQKPQSPGNGWPDAPPERTVAKGPGAQ